jgi:hypothetical protein
VLATAFTIGFEFATKMATQISLGLTGQHPAVHIYLNHKTQSQADRSASMNDFLHMPHRSSPWLNPINWGS